MEYVCIEKTIEFEANERRVRLWIDNTHGQAEGYDYIRIIDDLRQELWPLRSDQFIEVLSAKIPHLNAAQVASTVTSGGCLFGSVHYTTSFQDDVHG